MMEVNKDVFEGGAERRREKNYEIGVLKSGRTKEERQNKQKRSNSLCRIHTDCGGERERGRYRVKQQEREKERARDLQDDEPWCKMKKL